MRRHLLALVPLLLAAPSGAQVIRRGSLGATPPSAWVSGTAAATQGWTVTDGTTGSAWRFGSGTAYGASLEKAYGGFSVGVRGATSLVPLYYQGNTRAGVPVSTDADARVSQLLAGVHVAGDRGFHTVVELNAGATNYASFRSRAGEALAPTSDTDFTFAFGYGAGFGLSDRFAVELIQDITTVLHQRTGLSGSEDTNARVNSTRLVGRIGLGQRR